MSEALISYIKTIESGLRPVGGVNTEDGEIPSLGGENIVQTGGIKYDTIKLITKEFYANLNRGKLQEGDVLINKDGANTGKVGIYFPLKFDEAAINEHLFLLRGFSEKVDQFYLYYILLSEEGQKQIFNRITGSAQPGLNANFIKKFKFTPPSLPTQRKIARILSTADAVIEKTQAAIAKYKAIKQGVLHDLFTRGIDPATNKLRPTYEDAPHLYKPSKLGWIPKEWEDCKMGKYILENLYGPRFNARDYAENGNVKTIRGTDFTKEGEILYEQTPKALLPNGLIKIHKLRDGDVVIVTTADCGLTAIFKKPINDVDFIPSAYSVKYRFAKNINPHFIKYFMATDSAIRQVNKFVRQGTLGNLPGSDVLRFEMIYPDSDEQIGITNRLKNIDNKLQTEQSYLKKLQQIKAGLMADLLSGKKKVTVEEEPAN